MNNLNIFFIGPFTPHCENSRAIHHDLIPYLFKDFNYRTLDTVKLSNKIIDIDKLVNDLFKNNNKTLLYFTSGPWLGNNNNKIINHNKYYKVYEIFDQKIDKQLNVILKPNKFNGFLYKFEGEEMDILIKQTPEMDHFKSKIYCNENDFKNWNQEKIYDVLFYGSLNIDIYPLRQRLFNICKKLNNEKKIAFRVVLKNENLSRSSLSKEINKSYLCISCKTKMHDRFLGKYQEIPFSYSCILGDVPTRYRNILNDNIIETDINMTDNEIENIILKSLDNKQDILKKTKILHDKLIKTHTYEVAKQEYMEIINTLSSKLI